MKPQASDLYRSLNRQSLSVDEARKQIISILNPLAGDECIAIRSALDRTLAHPVVSQIDVPAHTNSAMDGYAVRASDIAADGKTQLKLIGQALAGHPFSAIVRSGECVRITTGAVMPEGCDSVVIQEKVKLAGETVIIHGLERPTANVRSAGEDVAKGSEVFVSGHKLRPADIGVLASLGVPEVKVKRPVRVAFFSTGDELRSIGTALKSGEIYDSNRYTLYSMLEKMGCQLIDMGIIADEPGEIRRAFSEAANIADVILTSGGVSVGDADYVKQVLDELGQIEFWKINMKPGRPLAFGQIGDAVFFGLPGNPVAVMVTFYQFVRPALRKLLGESLISDVSYRAICTTSLKKSAGRTEFLRGILSTNVDGELTVASTGAQGSGMLSSMARANCFIVLPERQGTVEAGSLVQVQAFDSLYS